MGVRAMQLPTDVEVFGCTPKCYMQGGTMQSIHAAMRTVGSEVVVLLSEAPYNPNQGARQANV
jgi:hypothetical protein